MTWWLGRRLHSFAFLDIRSSFTSRRLWPGASIKPLSEQSRNPAVSRHRDLVRGRHLGQARHGHDLTADGDKELGTRRQPYLADRHDVVGRRTLEVGIGREAVLGLGDADRVAAEAGALQVLDLVP